MTLNLVTNLVNILRIFAGVFIIIAFIMFLKRNDNYREPELAAGIMWTVAGIARIFILSDNLGIFTLILGIFLVANPYQVGQKIKAWRHRGQKGH